MDDLSRYRRERYPHELEESTATASCGSGFHEKATPCRALSFPAQERCPGADQREAPQASSCFPFLERFFLPSPNRPASIRTLHGAARSGASWGPQSQRALPSQYRTEASPFPEAFVPPRPRSHPNSAILLLPAILKPLRFSNPAWRCCSAAARKPHPSPTTDATAPPASALPPRWPASSHSCPRVGPASSPIVSGPYPGHGNRVCNALPAPATFADRCLLLW